MDLLEKTRSIIMAWPETSEKISHGHPTWWGGKKTFASFHDGHHQRSELSLWIKSDPMVRDDLVQARPDVLFVPPYVGPAGWIGVRLDRDLAWSDIEKMLLAGYKMVAPKRALKKMEEAS